MLTNLLKLISSTITLASLFMIRTSLSSRHRYIPLPIAWGISLFSVHKEIERKFIPVQYHHNHNHNPSSSSSLIIIIRNQLFIRRRRCSLTVSLHSRSLERSVAQKMWQGLWTWACWYGLLRVQYQIHLPSSLSVARGSLQTEYHVVNINIDLVHFWELSLWTSTKLS
jgi:hypothetical protein